MPYLASSQMMVEPHNVNNTKNTLKRGIGSGNLIKKRSRSTTSVNLKKCVHERVKNYTDKHGLMLQEFVSERLDKLLDKIEFNKKYFGNHLRIEATLPDAVVVFDGTKDKSFAVTIKANKLYCKDCDSTACSHVIFALANPDVGVLHTKLVSTK